MPLVGANDEPLKEAALFGYDDAAWQKLALLWGYTDVVSEALQDLNLAAGNTTLTGTAVPAGEIWRILGAVTVYQGTSPTRIQITYAVGGQTVIAIRVPAPTPHQSYAAPGEAVLKEGDSLSCTVIGATLNDDLLFYYWGYKMGVA